jgi:hypothetical protein
LSNTENDASNDYKIQVKKEGPDATANDVEQEQVQVDDDNHENAPVEVKRGVKTEENTFGNDDDVNTSVEQIQD